MKIKYIASGLAALIWVSSAQAQSAGSIILTTGWFHFAPQDASKPLQETNVGGSPVDITLPNSGTSVSNSDTIGFSGIYFITDNIAAEAVLGMPPEFKLYGSGSLSQYGQLGETRQWSPTVLLKYYFRSATAKFRPFIGLGLSRVWFTDSKITNTAFEQQVLEGPTSASADSSWAPVFNGGFTYQFTKHWYGGFSISYLPLTTTATLQTVANTPVGPLHVTSQAHVRLNPIVTYLNIGYRF